MAEFISIISLVLSLLSFLASLALLTLQQNTVYPKIEIFPVAKCATSTCEQFCLKFSEIDRSVYLFATFRLESYSPTDGNIYNFYLKYAPLGKLKAISDTSQLPNDILDLVDKFVAKGFNFDTEIKTEKFAKKSFMLIFQLNADCFVSKKKRFKLKYSFHSDKRQNKSVRFAVDIHHYILSSPPSMIKSKVFEKQDDEFKKQQELESKNKKLNKLQRRMFRKDALDINFKGKD